MSLLQDILAACWHIYRESAVYMLMGFLIAGALHIWGRQEKVSALLGGDGLRPVFLAALIGTPLPLCSCGVVPAAAGLKRQGAGNSATVSFLISTPESGVDSIAVTYALIDPVMTVMRPVAAFVTAIFAGLTESLFGAAKNHPPPAGDCQCHGGCMAAPFSTTGTGHGTAAVVAKLSRGLRYAFVTLLGDVGRWFLVGILIAGIITFFLPDTWLPRISEHRLLSMLFAMAAGIPMYVCATASTPIAAALILKGLNPGAALVFLLLGPATNIASLSMIYGLLGRRSLLLYLGSMVTGSIVMGYVVDIVYSYFGIVPTAVAGKAGALTPPVVELSAAVVLGLLLINALLPSRRKNET